MGVAATGGGIRVAFVPNRRGGAPAASVSVGSRDNVSLILETLSSYAAGVDAPVAPHKYKAL